MSENDVAKMKVADLKKELKTRGLPTTGNKTDLIDRLQGALIDGDVALEHDLLGDDDEVLNDDELDEEDTKSLLDSNHDDGELDASHEDDAVLNTPPESAEKTKVTEISPQKRIVLKRKLVIAAPESGDVISSTPTELIDVAPTLPKSTKTSITGPSSVDTIAADTTTAVIGPDTATDENIVLSEKKPLKLSELSAQERLELRSKKFGTPIVAEPIKIARSGKPVADTAAPKIATSTVSVDILKKRAERFGGSVSKVMNTIENKEKLDQRSARFGKSEVVAPVDSTNKVSISSDELSEKAKQRLERFKPTVA